MNATTSGDHRRFHRDSDRAMLGGVCAGIADYFGFNLSATRFVAVVAFLMTGPILIVAYVAAVFLVPSSTSGSLRDEFCGLGRRCDRRQRRRERAGRAGESAAGDAAEAVSARAAEVRQRCADLDARLKRLERHVTSRQFQIDEELRRL